MTTRIRMPADIELEDKLAFGLSARQLLLLAGTALPAYGIFSLASAALPLPIAAGLTVPLILAGVLLALGRRDGLSGDRYALALARHLTRPRRRVLAPEGIPPNPTGRQSVLAPLDLPVRAIRRSGVVELTSGNCCVVLHAASAAFALRSDEEQEALVAGFGRFLNSLVEPAQIVVRSEPVDLHTTARDLLESASGIDNAPLRDAAAGYARFLGELSGEDGLRRREILLVLTAHGRDTSAAETLERRAQEAIELLRPAGVELEPLAGEAAAELLARALDPPGPPKGSRLEGVIRRS